MVEDAELMATDELEWICVFNISLKESDHEAICNGCRLTDMHINAAQKIFFGISFLYLLGLIQL